ncbi:NinE family protein [Pantoea dispersa]|uniref:NinE family protein n=1 Tax=Pantoea TaxID=53335 RepID=UPI00226A850D|nr:MULTISPECIES: NinE family protein [Pantoea]MEB5837044.1 NinE family protein [Pantoea dispersa]
MSRQRKSPTQIIMDNMIFKPTPRTRSKRKIQPPANEVKTFDYTYGLLRAKWNRMRLTR